jgi:hypothetical protein
MMKAVITILFSLLLVGCPKTSEGGFTELSKGSLAGNGSEGFKKENIVISSKEEWKSFLSKIDTTNKVSKTFENSIDFSKEMVLVCLDKVRNSGGFSIEIVEATKEGGAILIKVSRKGPKPGSMAPSVIMQPYHIVKIKKTNKEIKFLEL